VQTYTKLLEYNSLTRDNLPFYFSYPFTSFAMPFQKAEDGITENYRRLVEVLQALCNSSTDAL